ncbi:MAG: MarR family transcriptional regulator [Thermomicrobiales bacterium]
MNDSDTELSGNRTNLDKEADTIARQLPELSRAMHCAVGELSAELQITPGQVKVLLHLSRKPQMTVGEIADALSVSMPAASELVDRLVDAGHVTRGADPADRRRVLVSAAPEAARITKELVHLRRTQAKNALLRLEPHERACASRVLAALITELGAAEETRPALARKPTRLA